MDRLKQRWNKYFGRKPDRSFSSIPYIIMKQFEHVTEEECIKIDRENEKLYKKLITKARTAERAILNSGLSMNLEVPMPPHPSNRDRYILWKKRNVKQFVIPQSKAVVYLSSIGYILNEHYDAYQAIDLANELRKKDGKTEITEDYSDNSFDKVYTKDDKNVFRRRSMYGMDKFKQNVTKFNKRHDFQEPDIMPFKEEDISLNLVRSHSLSMPQSISNSDPNLDNIGYSGHSNLSSPLRASCPNISSPSSMLQEKEPVSYQPNIAPSAPPVVSKELSLYPSCE